MRWLTKRLLQTACIGASVFTLALGPTRADAQGGCPGNRGMNRGGSPGMMGGKGSQQGMMGQMGQGGGGMGGGGMGGMGGGGMGRGGMGGMGGGMGSQQGMMGPMRQGMGGMGGMRGQSNMAQHQGMMANMRMDPNDPAAVLAHKDDLSLTKQQVQRLERMLKSGKMHAAPLLSKEQKKKFQELAGTQAPARDTQRPMTKPGAKAKPLKTTDPSEN